MDIPSRPTSQQIPEISRHAFARFCRSLHYLTSRYTEERLMA